MMDLFEKETLVSQLVIKLKYKKKDFIYLKYVWASIIFFLLKSSVRCFLNLHFFSSIALPQKHPSRCPYKDLHLWGRD